MRDEPLGRELVLENVSSIKQVTTNVMPSPLQRYNMPKQLNSTTSPSNSLMPKIQPIAKNKFNPLKGLTKFDTALEEKLPKRKRSPDQFEKEALLLKDTLKSIDDMKRRTGDFNHHISESDAEISIEEVGEQQILPTEHQMPHPKNEMDQNSMLDYNLSEDSDNNAASPEDHVKLGSTKKSRKHHKISPVVQRKQSVQRESIKPVQMKRGFYNARDEDEITFKSASENDCESSVDLQRSIDQAWREARDQQRSEAKVRVSKHYINEQSSEIQEHLFRNQQLPTTHSPTLYIEENLPLPPSFIDKDLENLVNLIPLAKSQAKGKPKLQESLANVTQLMERLRYLHSLKL
ncbi:hypothetical protein FGO68_gene7108 [Halteria grandinella]|uniref:Uncharacterized protein n=1 Tax=Halteria grandinella TaxID=5974 RepID=A0A8J8P251_HALGN|nr:hypothetical protein FGO68_gene7108 [Halteria grandinella]